MPLAEWQEDVLETLHRLEDEKHFKYNVYTVPEMVELLKAQGIESGFSNVKKFLYELKSVGVLRKKGEKEKQGRIVFTYVFFGKKANSWFIETLEDSSRDKLMNRAALFWVK